MAIKVSENGRLFTLQTKDSSYQMFADDKNVLLHLYYGEKIGEENLSGLIFCTDMGFAGNPEEAGPNRKYSLDTLPQEIPGSGVGDFRDDMIDIPTRTAALQQIFVSIRSKFWIIPMLFPECRRCTIQRKKKARLLLLQ